MQKQDVNIRSLKDVPVAVEPKRQENEVCINNASDKFLTVECAEEVVNVFVDILLSGYLKNLNLFNLYPGFFSF